MSRTVALVLVCLLAIAWLHVSHLTAGHEWGDDFAMYLLHARNLAEGRPYVATGYLYNPQYPQVGPPAFPPLTPLLLAPVYAARGLDFGALKTVMVGCLLFFLAATFFTFRPALGDARSLLLVVLLGASGFLLRDSNTVNSDLLFLAVLYGCFLLVDRADRALPTRRMWWYLAVGLMSYLAYAARTPGAVVLAALWLRDLVQLRRITRPVLLASLAFAVPALLQDQWLPGSRQYLDQYNVGAGELLHHARGYVERLAAFFGNGHLVWPALVLFGLFAALSLIGFVRQARAAWGVRESFFVLYGVLVLAWPSYEAERYLYPIIPLWLAYALQGLDAAWLRRRRAWIAVALGVAMLASYGFRYSASRDREASLGVMAADAQAMFRYVAEHTADSDVVVFFKPRAMALFARRTSAAYHCPGEDRQLLDYFDAIRVTHVVVIRRPGILGRAEKPAWIEYLREFVGRHARQFESVWKNDDFEVYRVRTAEAGRP